MVQTVGGLFVMFGSMAAFASTVWLVTTDYITPPIPTGWVVGMTLMSLGTGITVGSSIIACKKHKDPGQYITIALLGATLIGFGIRESIILHPLELPDCPCKANYFGKDCTYCPVLLSAFVMVLVRVMMAMLGLVNVFVTLDGTEINVRNVQFRLKVNNAILANVIGRVIIVIYVTLVMLVLYVTNAMLGG